MRIIPILLLILLISAIVLPVAAEDSDYDDMLNKTQKLNIIVPEKGTAVMGTKESMLEYVDWLNASSDALNAFFDKIMNATRKYDIVVRAKYGLAIMPEPIASQ